MADAVAQVDHLPGVSALDQLELGRRRSGRAVEAHAVAEQDRSDVDDDLVEEPGPDDLARRDRSEDTDRPTVRRAAGDGNGVLDPVGEDGYGRIVGKVFGSMGEHEYGPVQAPP